MNEWRFQMFDNLSVIVQPNKISIVTYVVLVPDKYV
jgi:hypothetical protein